MPLSRDAILLHYNGAGAGAALSHLIDLDRIAKMVEERTRSGVEGTNQEYGMCCIVCLFNKILHVEWYLAVSTRQVRLDAFDFGMAIGLICKIVLFIVFFLLQNTSLSLA